MISRLRLRQRAGHFWHEYTRMRTAIFFLIGVLVIVGIGSFVPQQDTSDPGKVQQFLSAWPTLNGLFAHVWLPLTDVFVSPVFYVLLGSLYLALAACVIRRGHALVARTLRGYPRSPQYWGEWGSWLFHTSFFLLLVAVVFGKATGYQGLVALTEGQSFTDTRAGYDQLQEGLLFNGQHAGFTMRLNSFAATYADNGEASDYVSHVSVIDGGRQVLTKDIRVNDFLGYDGVNIYQQDYGWAPTILVTNPAGQTVFQGPIQFFDDPGNAGNKGVGDGVLKVPDFGYRIPGASTPIQIGAKMAFFPDAKVLPSVSANGSIDPLATSFGPGGVAPRNPVVELQLWVGDLGLNGGQAQNVNLLNTAAMQPYFADAHVVPLALGQSISFDLPGAGGSTAQFKVSFPSLHQYSLFLVNDDHGVVLIYVSFALVMTGLLTKLYLRPFLEHRARRRRRGPVALDPVWTQAASHEPQETVTRGSSR